MDKLILTFTLLVVYQFKHFIADFPLQGVYMLGKFKKEGWVKPLAAHCAVHGLFTLLIVLLVRPELWWLSLVDFVCHFTMDRIKASPKMLGRFKALSADEMNRLISMGQHDPSGMMIPSLTLEGEKWRRSQFLSNKLFWWSLGLDQKVHHLTHYYVIWRLVT